jgi:predicted SAM-dependent methyltransferase
MNAIDVRGDGLAPAAQASAVPLRINSIPTANPAAAGEPESEPAHGSTFLNLGCGAQPIAGFVNIDREPGGDVVLDVTAGLPYADNSIDGIYSEHFIEHLSQGEGAALLRECRRVLRPGAAVRVATPDLDEIVQRYGTDAWLGSGMKTHGYEWVQNRCEMLNLNMREWGHQWLYNEPELVRLGRLAGLAVTGRCALNQSEHAMLRGRETRPESLLIVEFVKPRRAAVEDPLVSILIPAYNPRYFEAALASACRQTYAHLEIIVCDDSPGGEIEAATRAAAQSDPRVQYYRNDPRQGPRGNYLYCLGLANGEYIKFLNDDDLLAPQCVGRMAEWLQRRPDVTLVTSHRRCIDADGEPLPDMEATKRIVTRDSRIDGVSLAHYVIATGMNVIGEPTTAMFRRSDVADAAPDFLCLAGMPMPGIGDVGAWLSLLSKGDAVYLVESQSSFRQHPEQWQRQPGVADNGRASWDKLRYHGQRLGLYFADRAPVLNATSLPTAATQRSPDEYYAAARVSMTAGDLGTALELLEHTITADPCHAPAHNDAGQILLAFGDATTGLVLLQRAHSLAPEDADIAVNLAAALARPEPSEF